MAVRQFRAPASEAIDLSPITSALEQFGQQAHNRVRRDVAAKLQDAGATDAAQAVAEGKTLAPRTGVSDLHEFYNKAAREVFLVQQVVNYERAATQELVAQENSPSFEVDETGAPALNDGRPIPRDRMKSYHDNMAQFRANQIAEMEANPLMAPLAGDYARVTLASMSQGIEQLRRKQLNDDMAFLQMQVEVTAQHKMAAARDQALEDVRSALLADDPRLAAEAIAVRAAAAEAVLQRLRESTGFVDNTYIQNLEKSANDTIVSDVVGRAFSEFTGPNAGLTGLIRFNKLVDELNAGGLYDDNQQPRYLQMQDDATQNYSRKVAAFAERRIGALNTDMAVSLTGASGTSGTPIGTTVEPGFAAVWDDIVTSTNYLKDADALSYLPPKVVDDLMYIHAHEMANAVLLFGKEIPVDSPLYGMDVRGPMEILGSRHDDYKKHLQAIDNIRAQPDTGFLEFWDKAQFTRQRLSDPTRLTTLTSQATAGDAYAQIQLKNSIADSFYGPYAVFEDRMGRKPAYRTMSPQTKEDMRATVSALFTRAVQGDPSAANELLVFDEAYVEGLRHLDAHMDIRPYDYLAGEGLSAGQVDAMNVASRVLRNESIPADQRASYASVLLRYGTAPPGRELSDAQTEDVNSVMETLDKDLTKAAQVVAFGTGAYDATLKATFRNLVADKIYAGLSMSEIENSVKPMVNGIIGDAYPLFRTTLGRDTKYYPRNPNWEPRTPAIIERIMLEPSNAFFDRTQTAGAISGGGHITVMARGDNLHVMVRGAYGKYVPLRLGVDVDPDAVILPKESVRGADLQSRSKGQPVVINVGRYTIPEQAPTTAAQPPATAPSIPHVGPPMAP